MRIALFDCTLRSNDTYADRDETHAQSWNTTIVHGWGHGNRYVYTYWDRY